METFALLFDNDLDIIFLLSNFVVEKTLGKESAESHQLLKGCVTSPTFVLIK